VLTNLLFASAQWSRFWTRK